MAPKSVSGRVVNTSISSPSCTTTGKRIDAPVLRPIREVVAQSDAYLKQTSAPINHALFIDALAYAVPLPVFRGYEEWGAALGDSLSMVWTDQMTLDEGIAEAVAGGDAALETNN